MPENVDDAKGRIEKGTADLTGDEDLERQRKIDQGSVSARKKVSNLADKVKDVIASRDRHR